MDKKITKNTQINVSMTSKMLGLSERTVLNYINSKEIEAVKVGKQWHVNRASVEAFRQKYGFKAATTATETTQTSSDVCQRTRPKSDAFSCKRSNLDSLRCFQLCKTAFEMPKWNPLETGDDYSKERLVFLKYKALESLGSGYHCFNSATKGLHYETSRSAIGAILAHLKAEKTEVQTSWNAEIAFLQDNLLPAYTALIKKIERRKFAVRA